MRIAVQEILEKGATPRKIEDLASIPASFERRKVPRINIALPVILQPSSIPAKIVNLSEAGICLMSKLQFSDSISTIKVKLPHETIETKVKPVWISENAKFVVGMRFSDLTEDNVLRLRQALLKYQTRRLLKRAKDLSKKGFVSDFVLGNVFSFVSKLVFIQNKEDFDGAYSLKVQEEISRLSDELVREGGRLESKIDDKLLIRQLKATFRRLVGHWTFQSQVMRRGFEKPRGYPGDSYLLELIYSNEPISRTSIGVYFDGYFLNNPYANAVRNRKDAMDRILWRTLTVAERPLHLLNIACGSCREIRDVCLNPALSLKTKITFSCFDQDREALDFSKRSLANIQTSLRSKIQFRFLEGDVLNFSKDPQHFKDLFGNPDVIYSIGLADYLPDRVLRNVIKFCYEILTRGGKLIVAFKDKGQDEFAPLPPDWFCDWKFIPRTSEDIRSIINDCKLTNPKLTLEWEWSKKIVFVTLQKE